MRATTLLTAIGSLSAEAVIKTIKNEFDFSVIGCDTNPSECLALSPDIDKFYQVCSSENVPKYLKEIEDICSRENVEYLLPLTDPEVDVLSLPTADSLKSKVRVCLPDSKTIEICRNKQLLYKFFRNDSIVNVIPTYPIDNSSEYENLEYPFIAKPARGRSSNGLRIISSIKELNVIQDKRDYIVQPMYDGSIFTVDYVRNGDSGKDFSVPRKELTRTVNGAGLSVQIVSSPLLTETASYIGKQLDVNGCINIEFISHGDSFYLMDINPRFSAGVAFSQLAGYDMVTNHLKCFMGRDIASGSYEQMTIARKYVEVITRRS